MRRRGCGPFSGWILGALLLVTTGASAQATSKPVPDSRAAMADLVARIRTADFEGNRPELARLFEKMAPYTRGPFASRAHYWRGFAMWRRAINGFNDNAGRAELAGDLKSGITEFEAALAADPRFTDAKIADASCWVNLSFISTGAERTSSFKRMLDLIGEAQKEAPENGVIVSRATLRACRLSSAS